MNNTVPVTVYGPNYWNSEEIKIEVSPLAVEKFDVLKACGCGLVMVINRATPRTLAVDAGFADYAVAEAPEDTEVRPALERLLIDFSAKEFYRWKEGHPDAPEDT